MRFCVFVSLMFLTHTALAQLDSMKPCTKFQIGLTPRYTEGLTLTTQMLVPEKSLLQLELGTVVLLTIPTEPGDFIFSLETFDTIGKAMSARLAYFTKFKPESRYYFGLEAMYRSAQIQENVKWKSSDRYVYYANVSNVDFRAYGFQCGLAYYTDLGIRKKWFFYSKFMAGMKNYKLTGDANTLVITYTPPGVTNPPIFNMNRYNYWKPNINLVAGIGVTLYEGNRRKK